MAHHEFTLPVTEAQVRALRIDDTVTLAGALYGIRDATQIALFDRGRATRFDLRGQAVVHTAPNVRKVAPSAEHPAGYARWIFSAVLRLKWRGTFAGQWRKQGFSRRATV